jgi:hypothetical protein
MSGPQSSTAACVDVSISNNATWQDAWQYDPDSTDWDFTGQSFKLEVKASRDDDAALATFTSAGSKIIVDSITERILHMNVDYVTLKAALPNGEYVYDLIMFDGSSPSIRVLLQYGKLCIGQGVTED